MAPPPAEASRVTYRRMTWDRVAIVEQGLDSYLETARPAPHRLTADAPLQQGAELTVARALALFEDQLASRQLDVASRELKKTNRSFYTIGSAGHENNALVGAQPAHRRSGIPALSVGRLHDGARSPAAGEHADPRHPARRGRLERGSDQPGPSQGVGQPGALGAAADEHHRESSSEGDGPRVQPVAGEAPRRGERPARRRHRRLLVRRRKREPRDRAVGHQHRPLCGAAGAADATAADLRGQRDRHQRAHPRGLDL